MKKTIVLLFIVVLICSMSLQSCKSNSVVDLGLGYLGDEEVGIKVFATDDICDLAAYRYKTPNIILPTEFHGRTITGTFELLFNGCDNDLESVIIPDTYNKLGYCTFYNHKVLKSIYIPLSVIRIDDGAIALCSDLTIFCEAAEKPEGWHDRWFTDCENINVVWGCKREYFPNH